MNDYDVLRNNYSADFASPRHWRGRCISINSRVILNGCNRIECSSAKSYARSIPNGDPSLCAEHDANAYETGLTFRIIPAHRVGATYGGRFKKSSRHKICGAPGRSTLRINHYLWEYTYVHIRACTQTKREVLLPACNKDQSR